ncbi:MAG: flagellar hook-length control protein FliK [Parvularculaceae bacterium]
MLPPTQAAETGGAQGRGSANADDAPTFSYALASSALTANAAAALQTHGATPSANNAADGFSPATPPADDSFQRAGAQATRTTGSPERGGAATRDVADTSANDPLTPQRATGQSLSSGAAPPAQAVQPTTAGLGAPPASPPTAPLAANAATTARSAPTDAARNVASLAPTAETARQNANASAHAASTTPRFAPAQTAETQAAATSFATRRGVGDATQFELRLDPPSLGLIDGRLDISADGRAVLELTFDTRDAFDLFRDDEAALRRQLTDAGLVLPPADLRLAYDPGGADDRRGLATASADRSAGDALQGAPQPIAAPGPAHTGLIDIQA